MGYDLSRPRRGEAYPHEVVTVSQGSGVWRAAVVLVSELNHGRDELNQPVASLPVVVPHLPVRIIHRGATERGIDQRIARVH